MLITVGYDISYEVWAPTPMVLMLYAHPSRHADIREREKLIVEPEVPVQEFLDPYGNRCARLVAPAGIVRLRSHGVVYDTGELDPYVPDAQQHPVDELPAHVLPYLLASRYCELEKFTGLAWDLFGQTEPGWSRVQAVCDWVHSHVTFGYQYARSDKTAYEVMTEGRGVCRDFTHLAISFCRALNIPARYTTGYLGDISIPPVDAPMDFSAWFQVYLGGEWRTFDARHNKRRVGRILMARGRDATDVALTTTFGRHVLRNFTVWSDEVPGS